MTRHAHATVAARRDSLIVSSYSQTTAGFWVGNGAFEILDRDVGDDLLGEALKRALAESRTAVPVPDWSVLPIAPILTALGLKSVATYMKGTTEVSVTVGESMTLTPTRNGGTRQGFVEILSARVSLDRESEPAVLGRAVREALSLAE